MIKPTRKKLIIILSSVLFVLVLLVGGFFIYVSDYYEADAGAIEAFLLQGETWQEDSQGNLVFAPEGATKGLIFYPGGKVEYTAYIPLMHACAEQGILCVLVEMSFNLAVLDVDAAAGIPGKYPQIESWYIGGHSLGGSMAAAYASDHPGKFEGLVLLGAYSTANLSDTGLSVLSIYGSEDKVMNRGKYSKNKSNLPEDFTTYIIEGGCHAYFGMYGEQDGDGTPTISNEEQIWMTAEKIGEYIGGVGA